jgi:hypothetical protein
MEVTLNGVDVTDVTRYYTSDKWENSKRAEGTHTPISAVISSTVEQMSA